MFDNMPSTSEQMQHMCEQFVRQTEKFTECICAGYETSLEEMDDLRRNMDLLGYTMDDMEAKCRAYEEELRFLGDFVSSTQTVIPMEAHPIDFGIFLRSDDPRKKKIGYLQELL